MQHNTVNLRDIFALRGVYSSTPAVKTKDGYMDLDYNVNAAAADELITHDEAAKMRRLIDRY